MLMLQSRLLMFQLRRAHCSAGEDAARHSLVQPRVFTLCTQPSCCLSGMCMLVGAGAYSKCMRLKAAAVAGRRTRQTPSLKCMAGARWRSS